MKEKTGPESEERETQSVATLLTSILNEVKQQVQSEVRQQIQCEVRQIESEARSQALLETPQPLTGKAQEALELFTKIRGALELQPGPTVTLTASPLDFAAEGGITTLVWAPTNAQRVSIVGKRPDGTINWNVRDVPVSGGSISVAVSETTEFTATATGLCPKTATVKVNVAVLN